jgi:hypothetical protein
MNEWNALLDDSAREAVAAGNNLPDGLDDTTLGIIRDQAKSVAATIRAQKGVAPCGYCRGEGCSKCNQLGWLSRSRHDACPRKMEFAA